MKTKYSIFCAVASTVIITYPTLAQSSPWVYMGDASTGESIYVHRRSVVYRGQNQMDFVYKIGREEIKATAYCTENRWYASGYGSFSPQSRATQNMMNFVCGN